MKIYKVIVDKKPNRCAGCMLMYSHWVDMKEGIVEYSCGATIELKRIDDPERRLKECPLVEMKKRRRK